MSIRTRLVGLVACMALTIFVIGALGFQASSSAVEDLREIYEQQTLPSRELARLRRLLVENTGQMFRALQHNSNVEYAKLHDHPIGEHTNAIEKNLTWAEETWASLLKGLPPNSKEAQIAREIHPLYQDFIAKTFQPALARLKANDYSLEGVSAFLKANRAFEMKANPLFRDLAETQQNSVKQAYEEASARNSRMRFLSIVAMAAGLGLGFLVAFLTIRSITGPLNEMRSLIRRAAEENDFTGTIHVTRQDEIGETSAAFNHMMATLRASLSQIKQATVRMDDAVFTLAAASEQAAHASGATSESASSMAASVEQMSVSITSVSDNTREALNIAQSAGEFSDTGGKVIGSAVDEINQIATLIDQVSGDITQLGENSDRISSVVQVIKDVADQTNLLALNAAIEAARAGEAGRGFAVVADEVRKLAERTTKATGEIAEMISAIQGSSHTAVNAMGSTVQQVGKGTALAQEAGEAIVAIRQSAADVVRVVNDINDAMKEQGAASQDIARRVESVAQASEESNASVQQTAAAARSIKELSNNVRTTVDRFKL